MKALPWEQCCGYPGHLKVVSVVARIACLSPGFECVIFCTS